MNSLYVHFPFCETKCHYCDFYSLGREKTKEHEPALFARSLRSEAELCQQHFSGNLETIFFGGGTPSLTPPEIMEHALEPILKHWKILDEVEWTMEANPSSIDLENMKKYRNIGVNRVSMGVQALQDHHLAWMGRAHRRNQALISLDKIFEAGIKNVSVDLLCGIPGQTLNDLEESLKTLTSFPITHLSCYILTLAKHHRQYKELPDEETQLKHYHFIHDWMNSQGFEHYEISNFSKPGFKARHNLNYWKGCSYLGLGPSAHSYDSKLSKRWKNFSSLHLYSEKTKKGELPIEWEESLNDEQKAVEKWMLAVRLSEGFPKDWLAPAKANPYLEHGLFEVHPEDSSRYRLTIRGFALSDQIVAQLIS